MPGLEIYRHQEFRRQRHEQVRENSSRIAFSFGTWTSTGRGESTVPDVFRFGLAFLNEPAASYGFALSPDGIDLVTGHFPRCSGGVSDWQRDSQGYFVGAWVFFSVDTVAPGGTLSSTEPSYVLHHHMTFGGVATKAFPADLLDNF